MFKISIEQIDADEQEEVVIKCHEMNDYVLSLVKKLKEETKSSFISGKFIL